jgi:phage/plasmid-like protein (TIGR03299 family)
MTEYRHSPLADEAPGTVETIERWNGHTMGGRVPPFIAVAQQTGGVYWENPPSLDEALRQTGLDAEVTLEDLVVPQMGMNEHGEIETVYLPVNDYKVTVGHRGGVATPYAPVGSRYRVIQTRTVAEIGQGVIDSADDAQLRAVGAYGTPIGSRIFFAFDLGAFAVGGVDRHDLALILGSSHDGSTGLFASVAPMRFACTNMANGIFGRGMTGRWSIRHTESADGRIQEIRDALRLTWKYVERYQAEGEALLAEAMTEREFLAFQHELFAVPDLEDASQRQRTIVANRDEELLGIWNGPTNEFGRRTRWAAAQSVYEYLDWARRVRGAEDQAFARAERTLAGEDENVKAKTWNLLVTA